MVDLSGLTGDQQLQAGLFCGNVRPTLTTPLGTCTSGYGSSLIGLPKPGQENDDSNPPRVAHEISSISRWATTIFFTGNVTSGACS